MFKSAFFLLFLSSVQGKRNNADSTNLWNPSVSPGGSQSYNEGVMRSDNQQQNNNYQQGGGYNGQNQQQSYGTPNAVPYAEPQQNYGPPPPPLVNLKPNNRGVHDGGQRSDYDTGYQSGHLAAKKTLSFIKLILSPIVLPMIFFVGIVLLLFFAVVGSAVVVGNALGKHRNHMGQVGWGQGQGGQIVGGHGGQFGGRPGGNYGGGWDSFRDLSIETANLARSVLSSDECIERLSCELYKRARTVGAEGVVVSAIGDIPPSESVMGRISRSIKKNKKKCEKYVCGFL